MKPIRSENSIFYWQNKNNNNDNNDSNNNNNNNNNIIIIIISWFSQITPEPLYENEHATALWDVPLFADTTQVKANRIDVTVIDKTSKKVRVIEMGCPWL